MSTVEVQLAIDRLKVELKKPSSEDEESEREKMRHKIVTLQMRLCQLRDEEEAMVGTGFDSGIAAGVNRQKGPVQSVVVSKNQSWRFRREEEEGVKPQKHLSKWSSFALNTAGVGVA